MEVVQDCWIAEIDHSVLRKGFESPATDEKSKRKKMQDIMIVKMRPTRLHEIASELEILEY